jgi:hypothetical protein
LGKRGKGKSEKGNGDIDRGKGKVERVVHKLFFISAENREIGPIFMFFTG